LKKIGALLVDISIEKHTFIWFENNTRKKMTYPADIPEMFAFDTEENR
jgi:hypothetical protein